MRKYYSSLCLSLLLIGLPSGIFGQTPQMPSCAEHCFNGAVDLTGCATDDNVCACGPASEKTNVQTFLAGCLAQSCTSTEIADYQTWAYSVCLDVALSSISASIASMTEFYPATATAGAGFATTRASNPTTTVTSRPAAAENTSEPEPRKISIGLIIGAVVGGILLLGLITMAIIFCLWRRSKSKARKRALNPQQHQIQPLMAPQTQSLPQFAPYEVHTPNEPKPQMQILTQPVSVPHTPVQVPQHRPDLPVANIRMEMEGEGRKNFAEIGGTETVIRGDANRPAELGYDWDRGGRNRAPGGS